MKKILFILITAFFLSLFPAHNFSFAIINNFDLASLNFFGIDTVDATLTNLNLDYPKLGGVDIATTTDKQGALSRLLMWFYYFLLAISVIAAFIQVVWGGVEWASSSGDPGMIKDAKDRLWLAIIGLIIVLGSYLFIQLLNPDILNLKVPPLQ